MFQFGADMTKRLPRGIPGELLVHRNTKGGWRYRSFPKGTDERVMRVVAAAEQGPSAGRAAFEAAFGVKHTDPIFNLELELVLFQAISDGKPLAEVEALLAIWLRSGKRGRPPLRDLTDAMKDALKHAAGLKGVIKKADDRNLEAAKKFWKDTGIESAERFAELMTQPSKVKRIRQKRIR